MLTYESIDANQKGWHKSTMMLQTGDHDQTLLLFSPSSLVESEQCVAESASHEQRRGAVLPTPEIGMSSS
jgi:hypothetical protein